MLSNHPHEEALPSPEERRRIMERAGLILAEARALREQLDRVESQFFWNRPGGKGFGVHPGWSALGGLAAISAGPRSAGAPYERANAR